jgi:hypothetical protein
MLVLTPTGSHSSFGSQANPALVTVIATRGQRHETSAETATLGRDRFEPAQVWEDQRHQSHTSKEDQVALILLVLLLAILFAGLGFAVHILWIVAVLFAVLWLVGWAAGRGASSGSRRQWYGRW